jgi:hypothetical protein
MRQRDRDEFLSIMGAEGVPVDVARTLLRAGAALQRIAELQCNSEAADRDRVPCPGDYANGGGCLCRAYGTYLSEDHATHGMVPRIYVREAQIERRVNQLCIRHGLAAIFQSDPRGAVLMVKVPSGRVNDFGRTGVVVP